MALFRTLGGLLGRLVGRGGPARPPALVAPGARVRLRTPLASGDRVWIPAGAAGIVVGWDTRSRRASVELDTPRTVVTVPWAWLEEDAAPPLAGPRREQP